MFEGVILGVVNRLLGDIIEAIPTSQMRVNLSGYVVVENIQVRRDALRNFGIPVDISTAMIRRMVMSIPWSKLSSSPTVVEIDHILIMAKPIIWSKYNRSEDLSRLLKLKYSLLQINELIQSNIRDKLRKMFENVKSTSEKPSFTSVLRDNIIANLKLTVRKVHIRYEEDEQYARPLSCGVTINLIEVETCGANWLPAVVTGKKTVIRKLVKLNYVALYWSSNTEMIEGDSTLDFTRKMLEMIYTDRGLVYPGLVYVVQPIDAVAKLLLHLEDTKGTAIDVLVELPLMPLELEANQIEDLVRLMKDFSQFRKIQEHREYRPMEKPLKNPRAWWKYAVQAIRKRKRSGTKFWSEHAVQKVNADRRRYVPLWSRFTAMDIGFIKAKSSEKNKVKMTMMAIEADMTLAHIIYLRALGNAFLSQVIQEQVDVKKKDRKVRAITASDWAGLGAKIVEEWEVSKDAVGQGKKAAKLWRVTVQVESVSLQLKRSREMEHVSQLHRTLLLGKVDRVFVMLTGRGGKHLTVDAKVQSLDVFEFATPNSKYARILSPLITELGTQRAALFQLTYMIDPIDQPDKDTIIQVRVEPVLVVYSDHIVKILWQLLNLSETGSALYEVGAEISSQMQSRKLTKVEEEDTYDKLSWKLEGKKAILADIHVAAPKIVIPQAYDRIDTPLLVVDLGQAVVSTELQGDERDRFATLSQSRGEAKHAQERDFYSLWKVSLTDLRVFVSVGMGSSEVEPSWIDIIERRRKYDVIPNFALDFKVYRLRIATKLMPRFKVFGVLPKAKVLISKKRTGFLLELLSPHIERMLAFRKDVESEIRGLAVNTAYLRSATKKASSEVSLTALEQTFTLPALTSIAQVEVEFGVDRFILWLADDSVAEGTSPLVACELTGFTAKYAKHADYMEGGISMEDAAVCDFVETNGKPCVYLLHQKRAGQEAKLLRVRWLLFLKKSPYYRGVSHYFDADITGGKVDWNTESVSYVMDIVAREVVDPLSRIVGKILEEAAEKREVKLASEGEVTTFKALVKLKDLEGTLFSKGVKLVSGEVEDVVIDFVRRPDNTLEVSAAVSGDYKVVNCMSTPPRRVIYPGRDVEGVAVAGKVRTEHRKKDGTVAPILVLGAEVKGVEVFCDLVFLKAILEYVVETKGAVLKSFGIELGKKEVQETIENSLLLGLDVEVIDSTAIFPNDIPTGEVIVGNAKHLVVSNKLRYDKEKDILSDKISIDIYGVTGYWGIYTYGKTVNQCKGDMDVLSEPFQLELAVDRIVFNNSPQYIPEQDIYICVHKPTIRPNFRQAVGVIKLLLSNEEMLDELLNLVSDIMGSSKAEEKVERIAKTIGDATLRTIKIEVLDVSVDMRWAKEEDGLPLSTLVTPSIILDISWQVLDGFMNLFVDIGFGAIKVDDCNAKHEKGWPELGGKTIFYMEGEKESLHVRLHVQKGSRETMHPVKTYEAVVDQPRVVCIPQMVLVFLPRVLAFLEGIDDDQVMIGHKHFKYELKNVGLIIPPSIFFGKNDVLAADGFAVVIDHILVRLDKEAVTTRKEDLRSKIRVDLSSLEVRQQLLQKDQPLYDQLDMTAVPVSPEDAAKLPLGTAVVQRLVSPFKLDLEYERRLLEKKGKLVASLSVLVGPCVVTARKADVFTGVGLLQIWVKFAEKMLGGSRLPSKKKLASDTLDSESDTEWDDTEFGSEESESYSSDLPGPEVAKKDSIVDRVEVSVMAPQVQLFFVVGHRTCFYADVSQVKVRVVEARKSWHIVLDSCILANYYNSHLMVWEPLIEAWMAEVQFKRDSTPPYNSSIIISSKEPFEANISTACVETLSSIYAEEGLAERSKLIKTHTKMYSSYSTNRVPMILNETGSTLRYSISCGKKLKEGEAQRTNKVEPYAEEPLPVNILKWYVAKQEGKEMEQINDESVIRKLQMHDFWIHVRVDGPYTILDPVPANPPLGLHPIRLKANKLKKANLMMICNSYVENGVKRISLHSPIKVRNETELAIELRVLWRERGTSDRMMTLTSEQSCVLPIFAVGGELVVRIVDAVGKWEPSQVEKGFSMVALQEGNVLMQCAYSDAGKGVPPFTLVAKVSKRDVSGYYQDPETIPETLKIALHPPLVLENVLPMDIEYRIEYLPVVGKKESVSRKEAGNYHYNRLTTGIVKSGTKRPLHVLNCAKNGSVLRIRYRGYDWSSGLTLELLTVKDETKPLALKTIEGDSGVMTVKCHLLNQDGTTLQCSIFAEYWLVNNVGLPIVWKQRDWRDPIPGQHLEVHDGLCSDQDLDRLGDPNKWYKKAGKYAQEIKSEVLYSHLKEGGPLCVQMLNSVFSKGLTMGKDQWMSAIELKDGRKGGYVYELGLEMESAGDVFVRTQTLKLQPARVLVNATDGDILYRQKGSTRMTKWLLGAGQSIPLIWSSSTAPRQLEIQIGNLCDTGYRSAWSKGIEVKENMRTVIKLGVHPQSLEARGDAAYLLSELVRVDVQFTGSVMYVVFCRESKVHPRYVIDNRTSFPVIAYQKDTQRKAGICMEGGERVRYGWHDTTRSQAVIMEFPWHTSDIANGLPTSLSAYKFDTVGQLKGITIPGVGNKNNTITVDVVAEGPTRVIVMKQPGYKVRAESSSELSGAMDEDPSWIGSPKTSKKSTLWKVLFMVDEIRVSIVDNPAEKLPFELLQLTVNGPQLAVEYSRESIRLHCAVQYFQVDNQLVNTPMPVMVGRKMVEEGTDTGYMFEIEAHGTLQYADLVHFDRVYMRISEMDLNVDGALLVRLISFGQYVYEHVLFLLKHTDGALQSLVVDVEEEEDEKEEDPEMVGDALLRASFAPSKSLLKPVNMISIGDALFETIAVHFSFMYVHGEDYSSLSSVINVAGSLSNIDRAPVRLNKMHITHNVIPRTELLGRCKKHYVKQVQQSVASVLGHFDAFGSPLGLVGDVSSGMADLIWQPAQALVGTQDIGTGLMKGTSAFVEKGIGGMMNSGSKVTGNIGSGVAALTMDADFLKKRRADNRRKAATESSLKGGLTSGMKGFSSGMFKGIAGVVSQPISGAAQEGISGFGKGLGKGILGLGAKPVVGALDLVTHTMDGIKGSTTFSEKRQRVRLPRPLMGRILRSYDINAASGWSLLYGLDDDRFIMDEYEFHARGGDGAENGFVVVTFRYVLGISSVGKDLLWVFSLHKFVNCGVRGTGVVFTLATSGDRNPCIVQCKDELTARKLQGTLELVISDINRRRYGI